MSDVAVPQQKTIIQQVQDTYPAVKEALSDRIGAERFLRAAMTVLRTNKALQACNPDSVLGGLFLAAQLGLELGGPLAYAHLVPYGREAQLIVGYKGFIELFYRAGARAVTVDIIREGDTITRRTEAGHVVVDWVDADPLNTTRAPIGCLATIVLPSGEVLSHLMSKEQIEKRKPKTSRSGPWDDWREEMWMKTTLRGAARTTRLSSDDLALAVNADATITTGTGEDAKRVHVPVGEPSNPDQVVTIGELTSSTIDPAAADPDDPEFIAFQEKDATL
jgi:recombination protein RecT